MPGIGEDIEGANRPGVDFQTDFFEPRDQVPSSSVILGAHFCNVRPAFSQGSDSGQLDKTVGADQHILMKGLQGSDRTLRRDQVAEAPAGHGVGLGKTAEDESLPRELENAVLVSLVGQPVINLIRDQWNWQLCKLFQLPAGQDRACRVGRRIDQQGARPAVDQVLTSSARG